MGSSLVITGTNLTGATAVTIGGTAAASYVVDSPTQITATIGTGTTGTVQVTTPGGTATSVATFTVNTLPANPANPTSNSPQCNPPGVTLTRVGTPPAGVTWYWQTVAGGTSTANSGATFVATTSATYYIRAQDDVTGCWSASSGSLAITITPTLSTAAATPTPANAATGVCYAGGGAVTSISWGNVTGATSYDVYFGAGSVPGTVTANVLTSTYNTGALAANTTYYWRVVAKNACGDAPTSATFTFTMASAPCYCASSGGTLSDGVTGVNFNTINNLGTAVNLAYNDYTSINTTVIKGFSYDLNVYINTGGNYTNYQSVYFDWNGDGDFAGAGEFYNLGTATNVTNGLTSLSPLAITVPAGAITGSTRMRIQSRYNAATTGPCQTGFDGEVEDYTISIIDSTPCVTPTAQPTTLMLTPSSTAISGFSTLAIPTPDNYLVVISTSAVAPSPVNGTSYAIGSNVGAGYTVVDNDANTSFNATGLTPSTTYYFYIFSFNSLCTGGPSYLGTSPLTGNTTTTATSPTYCVPTTSTTTDGLYISSVAFQGTLNDTFNSSTFAGVAPLGYQDFTSLSNIAVQAQGEGINIVSRSNGSIQLRGTWKAWVDWNSDGTFDPATEEVYNIQGFVGAEATFGFVIPAATAPGNYRIRIRVNNGTNPFETYGYNFTPCDNFGTSGGTSNYGEAEDYLFTVIANCNANIVTLTNGEVCGSGPVTLNVTGTGTTTSFNWYSNEFGGFPITNTTTGTWITPNLTTTTTYWVTASNGLCESVQRTKIIAEVKPIPGLTFLPAAPEICGENAIVTVTATGDNEIAYLIDEDFETASLGVFSNINNDTNNATIDAITAWKNQPSVYVPTTNVWFPAISSGFGTNQFALAYSDAEMPNIPSNTVENSISLTNSVNSTDYLNLTLKLKLFYSRYFQDGQIVAGNDEFVNIELSTDGGVTYPNIIASFTSDVGIGTEFVELQYNLSAYINQPNLKIRVRHRSYAGTGWLPDGVAIDDVELFGEKPLSTSFNYDTSSVDAFTDAAATIPYTIGVPVSTIYIRPTLAQLANVSFIIPVTANLSNSCSANGTVTVTNKTKLWQPLTSNWDDALNWQPNGIPTIDNCVIIPATNLVPGTSINGYAKNLTVKNTGDLTIAPSSTVTVKEWVQVDAGGTFTVQNAASLIQIDNVANSGTANVRRTALADGYLDYVYWSTPVGGFNVNSITPGSTRVYSWTPTVNNGMAYAGNFGNWSAASGGMTTGRGYIVGGSSGTTTFTGVPNNGDITVPISRSTYVSATPYAGPTSTLVTADDDNWNLLGNPYPSAISADDFMAANSGNLEQFVKIWTHGIDPSAAVADPFYQDYQLNYDTNDYLTYNALGGTQAGFDGKIGTGQGFFVLMNDANTTSENALFNNTMRSNAHRNDQFYRSSTTNERHRIWLKLIHPNTSSCDALVGYATDATNSIDPVYDTKNVGIKTSFEIYSIAENKGLLIQGRTLPFDVNDQIQMGVTIPQNGIYTIAIDAVDGLFTATTQGIYVEDLVVGITHDLRAAPYTFTGTTGVHENGSHIFSGDYQILSE